ncbi:rCG26506 [Rattus norvegicus]|uniref:RCG26506 n=1 Tax=Rattus norvegicus TaxID=10116 RepID=A6HPY4_RAT|nr:rCG26506 [Rattus norvegicus]
MQRPRYLVAAPVYLGVGKRLVAKQQEGLVRGLARLLQEDMQDGAHGSPLPVAAHLPGHVGQLQEEPHVLEEVGAAADKCSYHFLSKKLLFTVNGKHHRTPRLGRRQRTVVGGGRMDGSSAQHLHLWVRGHSRRSLKD